MTPRDTTEPPEASLYDRFLSQVARTPETTAVTFGDESLAYHQLRGRANRLAHRLIELGVGPDVPVAIALERSLDLPVAVLGVLAAGGAYVPIDPRYPAERIAFMLGDCGARVLLTQSTVVDRLPNHDLTTIRLDRDSSTGSDADFDVRVTGDHLGYIIFTSGSTGRPKGVAMTRRALGNLIDWQQESSLAEVGHITLQFASLSFDVSFQEMFSTLTTGGTLALIPEELRHDPPFLLRFIEEHRVFRLFIPVVVLHQLAEVASTINVFPDGLREIITAGEALQITSAVRRFFERLPNCSLHNHYGPSETHVVTAHKLSGSPATWPALPPIGMPLPGCTAHIVDATLQPVADGAVGELLLGGVCVARGYVNRPELTAERFFQYGDPPERVYRTGDLARRSPDGTLEFLGRADDQVKIRGYRIELGEIEAALGSHPDVRLAAVAAHKTTPEEVYLVGYIVPHSTTPAADELRQFLAGQLPEYMVPGQFVRLDQLPLTPSGKVDRRSLPAPERKRPELRQPFAPPRTTAEISIATVWRDLLHLDRVGIDDGFFDLGGSSLALTRAHLRLQTELRPFPIALLFQHPTIRKLAAAIQADLTASRRPPTQHSRYGNDGIAIIGMAGRFPGADNIDEFWRNLRDGVESITFFRDDELIAAGIAPEVVNQTDYVKARGLIRDAEGFDAAFFGYPPREAELLDPQHRVFLETAWAALEHAGYDPSRSDGPIGVFAGSSPSTYLMANVCVDRNGVAALVGGYQSGGFPALFGNDKDYLATRVAYEMDLRGPSVSVQTACSTALVAVAQACDALAAGRCRMALAGGVSITVPRTRGYPYQEGAMVSPDGHCRAFDAAAAGTVFGEGVGIVVLKRLADAQADGDTIYAVIRGVGVTNDGAAKVSFTAPSVEGQTAAVQQALQQAGVDARSISYIEAHGTGTPLGDPIEIAGLTAAFRGDTSDVGFCAIGSAKTNIGHLEAAAGAAGLIKTVLALQHSQLPPTLHFQSANAQIDFAASPFVVQDRLTEWPRGSLPRRAGVSALGVGGTNAHVVLEELPPVITSQPSRTGQLLVLSAKTPSALNAATETLARFLEQSPDVSLADAAFTLQIGRRAFAHRRTVVADTPSEAISALRGSREDKSAIENRPVVFLFPGQGAQRVGMGLGLYESEPIFRQAIDQSSEILQEPLGFDLRDVHYAKGESTSGERLDQTAVTQPALFAVEYALAQLWLSWGVTPSAYFGHSIGEYVAACLAGVFALEDALRLVALRGKLIQSTTPGAMLAIRLSEPDVTPLLTNDLDLAAINGPNQCVVSGPIITINAFEKLLTERGVVSKRLPVSHAFHSSLLDPVLEEFRKAVAAIPRQPPTTRFISCVTGTWITTDQAVDAGYWAEHLRRTVRCADGLRTIAADDAALLEVGPGTTLTNLARSASDCAVPSLPRGDDARSVLEALGRLWALGVHVDWQRLHADDTRRRIALPTYPFEHQRFWIEPTKSRLVEVPDQAAPAPLSPIPQLPQQDEKPYSADAERETWSDVSALLAELSGLDAHRIDSKATFFELGFDSLGLTQAVVQIQKRFGVRITFRQLLAELPTIEALGDYVKKHRVATPETTPKMAPAVRSESEPPQGFGALAPVDRDGSTNWTPRQRRFIADLIERTTRRTARSKQHVQQYRGVHADSRTVSGFTKMWKEMVYPVVVDRSAGSRLWDIDGNEYIDLLNGFGPDLFGHSPPFVVDAIAAQLRAGYEVGPMSPLAGEVAQLICELTGMERASFVCTGSEAVQAAMRATRTVTGRDLIVLFARDYHGNFDEVLVRPSVGSASPSAPGIPASAVGNVLVLDYGTDSALATIRARAHELAAVLVEPVQSRRPEWQPRDFLHEVRRVTHDAGAALIFDEVITGFRLHAGGAQAFYGVNADLATYGKVIGGGMPFGVVAGRGAFMDAFDGGAWQFGDDSVPESGRTFFAGTFVRHPLALAAAKAALVHLRDAGPTLQSELNAKTDRLVAELNSVCVRSAVPLQIVNCGSVMFFRVLDGSKAASLLFYLLRDKGIYILEGFPSYLSTAHGEADLRQIADAFRASVGELIDAGFFGSPQQATTGHSRNGVALTGRSAPLTEAQRELWLAAQMGSDASCAYNESCHLRLNGALQLDALKKAVQALVDRHEALRATIAADGESQRFFDRVEIEMPVMEIFHESQLAAALENEDRQAFDLEHGPLIRCRLFRIGSTEHVLSLTVHHIVCDGWAYDILLRDLAAIYSAFVAGTTPALTPAASFAEYALRQLQWLHSPESDAIDAWWRLRFTDPPDVVELPTDRPRPQERSYRGARLSGSLGPELSRAVRSRASELGRTPYAVLFTAYQTLLHRLSGANELAVGIPTAGQALDGESALVGHCVHFLPIGGMPAGSFADQSAASHAALVDAFDHQRFTYSRLIRLLALPREANRPPLLAVTFNLDPEVKGLNFAGLTCSVAKNPKHFVNFDLHWNLVEQGDEFLVECEYATDLFDQPTIERWLDQYRTLLTAAIDDPLQMIDRLPLMTDPERNRVLVEWNATATPYPADRCVHQLFEDQASRSPDSIALESNGSAVNYGDLNRRANRLARRLRAAGVERDSIVAVGGDRSIDVIVGLLGVLKSGGAYLPLNPHDPLPRLKQLLADAQVRIVLTDRKLDVPGEVISLSETFVGDDSDLPNVNDPDDLAYVMYTSGSTGTPKGVAVPHRAIARLLFGVTYASFGADRVIGQLAPLAFDASTFEIWGALLHGGRCALYPGRAPSPAELGTFLNRHRVDTLFLTTGLFNTIVYADPRALAGIRQLLTGGEAISVSHVRKALSALPDTNLVHVYGPTETTTFAASWPIPRSVDAVATTLPIGRPIGNTTCFVVDARNELVPIGVIGELLIGGPGVARGYLNRPELTAERFVEFAGQRVYCTGDRVRWRPEGTLEFVGRTDRQVKIRGFRIEPGEIENALTRLPGVGAAAVVPIADSIGGTKLVAYVVPTEPSRTLTPDAVRSALRASLPEFMWPAHIVPLSRLPISPTGKLDRRALPPPIIDSTSSHEFIEPRDETERKLAELWREVLGVGRIGVHDDFFTLGGHSLLSARLFARMRERHQWELPLAKMFRTPTIAGLAEALRGEAAATPTPLLVPLRPGGTRTPLFCVPGVGSHVFTFRELAERLPADRPILGLEARGMDGRGSPHTRIEPMAAEYVAEIRRQHLKGPYHLAGYSLGGLVVFEMARQLAANGNQVGIVAILDAHAPGHPRRFPALKRLQIHASKFAALSWRERRTYIGERLSNRLGRTDHRSDYEAQVRGAAELSPSTRGVIEAHLGALHHYRPEPYPGRVQLFRSREQEAWSEMYVADYTMGWGELVEGGLDLYWVPGGHLEMFHSAAVETLTRQLGDLLRNAP